MGICKLRASDLNQVMDLFCDSFMQDSYYIKQYPNEEERLSVMKGSFASGILFCIEQGHCFGIFENDKMVSFLLAFDYNKVKNENPEQFAKTFGASPQGNLPYKEALHEQIAQLGSKTMYLLSIAVQESHRHIGIASAMVDYLMNEYADYDLVSDVSNESSLKIYKKRGFEVKKIDTGYYFIAHRAQNVATTFEPSDKIKLIIPTAYKADFAHSVIKEKISLCGYSLNENETEIICDKNGVCYCKQIMLDYDAFLAYQRDINVAIHNEKLVGDSVFYTHQEEFFEDELINDTLADMLPTRKSEWSIIPDVFVSIPMKYTSLDMISGINAQPDTESEHLLKNLDFRTYYELGIISNGENVDEFSRLKKRLKRYYLGKHQVQISAELTLDNYTQIGAPIGAVAYVDMYISVDTESSCAVLTWYSLSLPFLISHYFDNIVRNNLTIVENGEKMNVFDYLSQHFGVVKRGSPKIYAIIPQDKACLKESQIASLLASETIYPEGEDFGRIIDKEIMDVVTSKTGMGQYDRATIYAYNNVLLQFSPDFKGTIFTRLEEEAICQFFIELVLFEEAAIQVADRDIAQLLTQTELDPIKFLENVDLIHEEYSRTIDFWNIQLNYPTSQNSINMLRNAFKIETKHDYMQRNQQHMEMVFETKRNIIDRKDSKRMDTSLAVISVLAIFSAWMDSHSYVDTWLNVLGPNAVNIIQRALFVVILITASYVIAHLFGGKIRKMLDRVFKNRKNKSEK